MKERVLKELTPINVIYEEEMTKSELDANTLATFPTNQHICEYRPLNSYRWINRILSIDQSFAKARRKVLPVLPQSCLFDIPDAYKLTLDKKRFLLLDQSLARRERLLLFSSDYQLDILFNAHTVFMDGTFSKSPLYFSQIYIIHAVAHDKCMMEGKPNQI